MKLQTVMTAEPTTCSQTANLADVARLMGDQDCGFIPVVDTAGNVLGVITDRDICMAITTRHLLPEQISVNEVMSSPAHACAPDDTVESALRTMKELKVRRLPVVDKAGVLVGVVSMNDMLLGAAEEKEPSANDVLSALAAISAHRLPARVAA